MTDSQFLAKQKRKVQRMFPNAKIEQYTKGGTLKIIGVEPTEGIKTSYIGN